MSDRNAQCSDSSNQVWHAFPGSQLNRFGEIMTQVDPQALRVTHREPDSEARRAFDSSATMRPRQNALCPFLRIPTEILSEVFALIAMDEYEYLQSYADYYDDLAGVDIAKINLGWVKVSHVCHMWREVALSTATLWGRIPFSLPKWIPVSLVRSRGASLSIDYVFRDRQFYDSHPDTFYIASALAELQRAKVLSLYGMVCRTSLQFLATALTSKCAPVLEEFTLSLEAIRGADRPWTLPSNIFLDQSPRLRRLSISGPVLVPWTSHVFTGLTVLQISDPAGALPSMEQMSSVLRHNPQLVELSLTNSALPTSSSVSISSKPPISLDRLERLHVEGSVLSCSLLAALIIIPLSTRVSIVTDDLENHYDTPKDTVTALSSFLRPGCQTISLSMNSMCSVLTLLAWGRIVTPVQYHQPRDQLMSFMISSGQPHGLCDASVLLSIERLVDFRELRRIFIENLLCAQEGLDTHHWNHLLKPCCELRHVQIIAQTSATFLRSLSLDDGTFLPKLESVDIAGGKISVTDFKGLLGWAQRRKALGAPLQILRLRSCELWDTPASMCQAMQEEVVKFTYPDGSVYKDIVDGMRDT